MGLYRASGKKYPPNMAKWIEKILLAKNNTRISSAFSLTHYNSLIKHMGHLKK